ncbi:hypothetical protein A7U60_g6879 [Sanghuangporus baumii]|uniref:Uncharacterized protein n=1 Tax=Sanghuangporus baumii TaxID=108892 RepID=A0A9Q5NA33_SANBA|nr:hypothetical protein A7U60_g6879 [Sanghuangporus baumii]
MPGPRNSKKAKKQFCGREKKRSQRNALKDIEQNTISVRNDKGTENVNDCSTDADTKAAIIDADGAIGKEEYVLENGQFGGQPTVSPSNPFIVDPGNGPRVRNMDAFLSSFFCPPVAVDNDECMMFSREEFVSVLESVLPREVALIAWYNKTRTHERICPACQRTYRLGDTLADPISGELINTNDRRTPPHVLREQQLSGFCSFPCFFLASYSSHPYAAEVAQGTWGLRSDELSPQVRSLLDATDPRTASILRYGLAACTPSLLEGTENISNDQGLGRLLRLTRRKDLGFGEVLEALAWYEREGANCQTSL